MKLCATYTIFNGMELLEKSMESVYDNVDVIMLCFQEISNHGNRNPHLIEDLRQYTGKKIIKVPFHPTSKDPKENERFKLQLRIDRAKAEGCTHYIGMACDHFYIPADFKRAKEKAKDYYCTLSAIHTYYKEPTFRLEPIEDYYCPFINFLHPRTKVIRGVYKWKTDPSNVVSPQPTQYLFKEDEIVLHHYSMIRDSIQDKFNNAAARGNFKDKIPHHVEQFDSHKLGDKVDYYGGRITVKSPNYFNF